MLKLVLKSKNQTERYNFLSEFIQKTDIGMLNLKDTKNFMTIYDKFYTPDNNDKKVEIKTVEIEYNGWGFQKHNKHFRINKNLENDYTCSIKRLSGKQMDIEDLLNKAFRNVINDQILEFRQKNKLNPYDKCPLTLNELGLDAQVDHIKPFRDIVKDFKKEMNYNEIKYYYNNKKKEYDLEEPLKSEWYNYHSLFASLRYTSKKGNLSRNKKNI